MQCLRAHHRTVQVVCSLRLEIGERLESAKRSLPAEGPTVHSPPFCAALGQHPRDRGPGPPHGVSRVQIPRLPFRARTPANQSVPCNSVHQGPAEALGGISSRERSRVLVPVRHHRSRPRSRDLTLRAPRSSKVMRSRTIRRTRFTVTGSRSLVRGGRGGGRAERERRRVDVGCGAKKIESKIRGRFRVNNRRSLPGRRRSDSSTPASMSRSSSSSSKECTGGCAAQASLAGPREQTRTRSVVAWGAVWYVRARVCRALESTRRRAKASQGKGFLSHHQLLRCAAAAAAAAVARSPALPTGYQDPPGATRDQHGSRLAEDPGAVRNSPFGCAPSRRPHSALRCVPRKLELIHHPTLSHSLFLHGSAGNTYDHCAWRAYRQKAGDKKAGGKSNLKDRAAAFKVRPSPWPFLSAIVP